MNRISLNTIFRKEISEEQNFQKTMNMMAKGKDKKKKSDKKKKGGVFGGKKNKDSLKSDSVFTAGKPDVKGAKKKWFLYLCKYILNKNNIINYIHLSNYTFFTYNSLNYNKYRF